MIIFMMMIVLLFSLTNAKEASVDKIQLVHTLTWWPPTEDYMYSVSDHTNQPMQSTFLTFTLLYNSNWKMSCKETIFVVTQSTIKLCLNFMINNEYNNLQKEYVLTTWHLVCLYQNYM